MASLWGGRFSKEPSKLLLEYHSRDSLKEDERLVAYDLWVNRAHSLMLAKKGIISKREAADIKKALDAIEQEWKTGKFALLLENEDVHMNIEAKATELVGASAKKMHTARSRNDQVNTDVRLYIRDGIDDATEAILNLQKAILEKAGDNTETVMPAYTHTRVAQPISVAFWLEAHSRALVRDVERLKQARERLNRNCPLGACAVAGTSWPIDQSLTCKYLGFESIQENPMDAVSSRGEWEAEACMCLGFAMQHMSKLAQEYIMFSTDSFGFIELSDAYTTGSSIMPQKKNPDPIELARAKTARVHANLLALLEIGRASFMGHNTDTQETKQLIFQGLDYTIGTAGILAEIIRTSKFNEKPMLDACENGYASATDLADLLARKGVPFRVAHEITGRIVKKALSSKKKLSEIATATEVNKTASELGASVSITPQELKHATDCRECMQARVNGPATKRVKKEVDKLGKELDCEFEELTTRKKDLENARKSLENEWKRFLA